MVTRGHSGDLRAEFHALRPVDYPSHCADQRHFSKNVQPGLQLRCAEERTDEIGTLAHSLNTLADRLSATMQALQEANASLQADIHRERELEQARLNFFSAASHELKTPITIIKGQLSGMLDGIGAYTDRDKYLARSLTVLGQMEGLVQELLTLCRMEQAAAPSMTPVDLAACIQECIQEYAGLFEQESCCCAST